MQTKYPTPNPHRANLNKNDEMANPANDRNLLFGLQALQNGLITEDNLIEALKQWSFSKDAPLGDILIRQNIVSRQLVDQLDLMIDQQLALFDGDAQRGLATLSSVNHVAQAIQRNIDDEDVHQSLAPVLGEGTTTEDADATRTYSADAANNDLSRFQILHEHARGGLGRVSIALDNELKRKVALKEIRPEHSTDGSNRTRFVREAEITGQLEHPGIVPVYALGSHPDGRPFYAMKFVRGDSLKQAIRQYHDPQSISDGDRNILFRDLLQRFIDVCYAVAYAHSRGVLHRDLKPANIMLGKFGETLVVDWGLAKAGNDPEQVDGDPDASILQPESLSGNNETVDGQAMGTPAYMSPEQAEGKLNRLGPTSDVYSLGATLFHILTGQAPFQSDPESPIIARVIDGRFDSPINVAPRVDRALNAVCLKAMSRQQAQRYESPTELAREIERWLADEPVLARRQSVGERAWRWLRKNRAAALAGTAVIIIGAVASAAIAINSKQSERRERTARLQATEYLKRAAFTLVGLDEAAVDTLLPDIGDYELNIPEGANRASVYQLLTIASGKDIPNLNTDAVSAFLEGVEFLKERQSDLAFPELLKAYQLESDVRIFGFAACLAATNIREYEQAERIGRDLVARFPDDAEMTTHLASILQLQSLQDGLSDETKQGLLDETRSWLKTSIKLSPRATEARVMLMELAEEGTLEQQQEAEIQLRELVDLSRNPSHRYALVVNLDLQGKVAEALEEAIPLLEIPSPLPGHINRVADLYRKSGKFEEANEHYALFHAARENDPRYKDDVTYLNNWAVSLMQQRQFPEALNRFEELVANVPEYANHPIILVNTARALLGSGENKAAVLLGERARAASDNPLGPGEVVDSLLLMICAEQYDAAAALLSEVTLDKPDSPDRFATLCVALAHIVAIVHDDPSISAAFPELNNMPTSIPDDWDYYYIDQWLASQPDAMQQELSGVLADLRTMVKSRPGIPFKK